MGPHLSGPPQHGVNVLTRHGRAISCARGNGERKPIMDLTRRNFVRVCGLGLAGAGTVALVGCGGESTDQPAEDGGDAATGNAAKPVVFFNRQPSNSTTGELDMDTLNFNENTYYVGFDATQGGDLQGEMVLAHIKAHAAELDRTATASSATSSPSVTSATTTPSPVRAAPARRSAPASRSTATSTRPRSAPTSTAPPPSSRTPPSPPTTARSTPSASSPRRR